MAIEDRPIAPSVDQLDTAARVVIVIAIAVSVECSAKNGLG
jgi:hypothetical protein